MHLFLEIFLVDLLWALIMASWYFLCIFQCMTLPFIQSMTYGDNHEQAPLDNPEKERSYLRLVFEDGEEFFRNWECPDGIWAEEMHLQRKPNCVCVKGVFAIGTELCDDKFKIITGNEHCFDIRGKTIRKFIPLTGKSGFAGKANTVFRKDAPYFARLMSSVPTTSVPEAMNYLFRMNDPNDFSAYSKLGNGKAARLKCFLGQNVPEDFGMKPIMQITKLPNCSNEFRGPKDWCNDVQFIQDYEWTLQVGESWSPSGETAKGQPYPGSCSGSKPTLSVRPVKKAENRTSTKAKHKKSKPRPKRWANKKGSKKDGKGKTKTSGNGQGVHARGGANLMSQPKCDKFDAKILERPESDTRADHFMQVEMIESDRTQIFHSASLHQKEINKQNRRIAHQLRKFYMNGTTVSNFAKEVMEYKYIQIAKEILKKVCPEEYVPHHVVDVLTGTFRLLYLDSSIGSSYPIPFNEHEHTRIMDGLTKCKESALPISFVTNESHPDLGVLGTNQTFNETTFILYDLKTNLSMPGHVAFNLSSIDIALELVWKMTLLTHYYCSTKFIENPFDLSQLYVKVEAMLKNPMMQFRWYYPGQFNRIMQFFLMTHDLMKFGKGVDRCVATAYKSSEYPGWMSRPSDLLGYDGGRSKQLSHDVARNINSPSGTPERSGRKKRFYLQDDMWKKQAYCMHSTNAPYTEVRTSTFPSCKKKPAWFENID